MFNSSNAIEHTSIVLPGTRENSRKAYVYRTIFLSRCDQVKKNVTTKELELTICFPWQYTSFHYTETS